MMRRYTNDLVRTLRVQWLNRPTVKLEVFVDKRRKERFIIKQTKKERCKNKRKNKGSVDI